MRSLSFTQWPAPRVSFRLRGYSAHLSIKKFWIRKITFWKNGVSEYPLRLFFLSEKVILVSTKVIILSIHLDKYGYSEKLFMVI